jgi:hypothetical protein
VETGASLLVRYYAASTTRIDVGPFDAGSPAPPSGIRYVQTGSLVVDLTDAATGNLVWRGHVVGALRQGPGEIAEQIRTAVGELMGKLPAGGQGSPNGG